MGFSCDIPTGGRITFGMPATALSSPTHFLGCLSTCQHFSCQRLWGAVHNVTLGKQLPLFFIKNFPYVIKSRHLNLVVSFWCFCLCDGVQALHGQGAPRVGEGQWGTGGGWAGMAGWCEGTCGQAWPNGCWKHLPRTEIGPGCGRPAGLCGTSGPGRRGGRSQGLTGMPTPAVLHNEPSAERH